MQHIQEENQIIGISDNAFDKILCLLYFDRKQNYIVGILTRFHIILNHLSQPQSDVVQKRIIYRNSHIKIFQMVVMSVNSTINIQWFELLVGKIK